MKYLFLFNDHEVYQVLEHTPGNTLLTTSNFLMTTIAFAELFFERTGINIDKITEFKQTNYNE